jgi:hypothetical protein
MPVDQVKLPVTTLAASRCFYTAALVALGWGMGDGGSDDEPLAVGQDTSASAE